MKKLFISHPMGGLSNEEILAERKRIASKAKEIIAEPVEVLDSYFPDYNPQKNTPLAFLAKAITVLAEADIAYFSNNWRDARGCKIEYECAKQYGIKILEE